MSEQDYVERNRLWSRLNDAVAKQGVPLPTPVFVVDLDAFDANADDLVRRAGGKTIRVASKSLRIPALIGRALAHDGVQGVLAYTLREALWLHEQGISDDIVVAYPTVDRGALGGRTSDGWPVTTGTPCRAAAATAWRAARSPKLTSTSGSSRATASASARTTRGDGASSAGSTLRVTPRSRATAASGPWGAASTTW